MACVSTKGMYSRPSNASTSPAGSAATPRSARAAGCRGALAVGFALESRVGPTRRPPGATKEAPPDDKRPQTPRRPEDSRRPTCTSPNPNHNQDTAARPNRKATARPNRERARANRTALEAHPRNHTPLRRQSPCTSSSPSRRCVTSAQPCVRSISARPSSGAPTRRDQTRPYRTSRELSSRCCARMVWPSQRALHPPSVCEAFLSEAERRAERDVDAALAQGAEAEGARAARRGRRRRKTRDGSGQE